MDIDPSLITDIAIKNKISGLVQHFSSKDYEFTFSVDLKPTLNKDLMLLVFDKLSLNEQIPFTKINTQQFSQCSIKKLHQINSSITSKLTQEDLEKINPRTQKLYWLDLQILNLNDNRKITDLRLLLNLESVITNFNTGNVKSNNNLKEISLE